MPTESIFDGGLLQKDEEAARVYTITYDSDLDDNVELIDEGEFTISPVSEDDPLEVDEEALQDDDRSVLFRLSGGEQGTTYTVKHVVTTNETPSQTLAASFHVLVI